MSIEDIHGLIRQLPEPLNKQDAWANHTHEVPAAVEGVYRLWTESLQYGFTEKQRKKLNQRLQQAGYQLARVIETYDGSRWAERQERRGARYYYLTKNLEKIADALHVTVQHIQCPPI